MTRPRALVARAATLIGLAAAVATPAGAQYKIVAPDGRVTYTDLPPPPSTSGNVVDLGRRAPDAAPAPTLPPDLQRVASRYPVVIYTSAQCAPCDSGRQLLQQRGVPYAERVVVSVEDADALVQRTGTRSLPAMSVGAQVVRGFSEVDWSAYLDAAGYPRESRLPSGWAPPPAEPMVARRVAPSQPPQATAEAPAPAPALPPPPVPGTIRF